MTELYIRTFLTSPPSQLLTWPTRSRLCDRSVRLYHLRASVWQCVQLHCLQEFRWVISPRRLGMSRDPYVIVIVLTRSQTSLFGRTRSDRHAVMEVHGTKDSRRRHQSMYLVAIEHQLHYIPVVQWNRVWDTASPQCKRWMERHHLQSLSQYSSWGALIRFRETRTLIALFFPSLCLHGGKSGNPPQASHNISYSVKLNYKYPGHRHQWETV